MDRLSGQKILLTQTGDYMGPAIAELFEQEGAKLFTAKGQLDTAEAQQKAITLAKDNDIDVLVANLAHPPLSRRVEDILDDDLDIHFATMVKPLVALVRGLTPFFKAKGCGRIVAVTSAAPLRGIPKSTAYCTARGAQNAFVRAAGLELAAHNIQLNAIAQNYIRNEEYYPDELLMSERFQKHLQNNVPIGRIAEASESAELALFLASGKCGYIVGQVIPLAGGWATNC